MSALVFSPMAWLIGAFLLGVLELLTGTALIGGLAIGAALAAGAVYLFGDAMAASALGIGWPFLAAAIGALGGTALMNRWLNDDDSRPDIND